MENKNVENKPVESLSKEKQEQIKRHREFGQKLVKEMTENLNRNVRKEAEAEK